MEASISQKLKSLEKLQKVDSKLDEIHVLRGALPKEIEDLEKELENYEYRINQKTEDINDLEQQIISYNEKSKEATLKILKYDEQIENVRNNKEYNALMKEKESEELDIQVYEKRKYAVNEKIEEIKAYLERIQIDLEQRQTELNTKNSELDEIMKESEEEEDVIKKDREVALEKLDEKQIKDYTQLRNNAKNGLAVVQIERGACGGCFHIVPPQKCFDVMDKKKLITCEHCGRIFYTVIAPPPVEKTRKTRKTRTTRTTRAKKTTTIAVKAVKTAK